MTTVAQKTLLFSKLIFTFVLLFASQASAYYNETLEYKVELNGLDVGNAFIKFETNKQNDMYKVIANAKTQGFAKRLYDMNDSISVIGKIIDKQLVPTSHTLVLKENSYKANKTGTFDYTNDILKYNNNLKKYGYNLILINNAKDIFSTLFTLRNNTDLRLLKDKKSYNRTIQFVNKTVENKINISKPYDFKLSKNKSIKVRSVTIDSKRIRQKKLSADQLEQIMYNEDVSAKDLLDKQIYTKKDDKFEQNIKVIISNDSKKIPLIIEYKTKFGTFKATATKF